MARPLRIEFEDAIYHLCARGNARQPVFRDESDCDRFLKLLSESVERFEAAILCFVLMGNHFHLVAQTHRANLRRWMHWLLVSYTVYFNRRHCSSGHLFQGRYKSFLVQEGDYLLGLSRYVHLKSLRGVVASVDPQKILQRVAKKYGVDRQRLVALGERGLQAKNVAMWMIWESGTKSLREIGELFGGLDYAAVAQRIRRTRSAHTARATSQLRKEMLNVET